MSVLTVSAEIEDALITLLMRCRSLKWAVA